MEILFRWGLCRRRYLILLVILLALALFVLEEHQRKHPQQTTHCDAEYAALRKAKTFKLPEP